MGGGKGRLTNILVPAYGIDVSDNNGMLNWKAWKGHIQFAEIKCTEGLDYADLLYHQNMEESRMLGDDFARFPYHYGHPEEDPARQARFFTETAAPYMREGDNYVLDLEITGKLKPVDVSFWAWTFCTEVNRLDPGRRCIVQTFPGFAEEGNCAKLGAWHLWVMDWGVPQPVMPVGPWQEWAFWQHASGKPDRDVFDGTASLLRQFTRSTGPKV